MDTRANVQSLTSIESVRTALVSFVDQVGNALTELEAEMRRMLDWLEHDRPRHWKTQVRISIDQMHEAQQALHRCLMFPIANERPSCYEERAALKKAQARQVYCQEKVERVRHWQQAVQHELFEYQGRISQMVRLVEIDVPQAIGVLTRVLRHLEEYQAVRAAEPQTAYNDLALAEELMPAGEGQDASGTRVNSTGNTSGTVALNKSDRERE
jgi:exonuclease VII large subunit